MLCSMQAGPGMSVIGFRFSFPPVCPVPVTHSSFVAPGSCPCVGR